MLKQIKLQGQFQQPPKTLSISEMELQSAKSKKLTLKFNNDGSQFPAYIKSENGGLTNELQEIAGDGSYSYTKIIDIVINGEKETLTDAKNLPINIFSVYRFTDGFGYQTINPGQDLLNTFIDFTNALDKGSKIVVNGEIFTNLKDLNKAYPEVIGFFDIVAKNIGNLSQDLTELKENLNKTTSGAEQTRLIEQVRDKYFVGFTNKEVTDTIMYNSVFTKLLEQYQELKSKHLTGSVELPKDILNNLKGTKQNNFPSFGNNNSESEIFLG